MSTIGIDASRANKTKKTGTERYAWQMIRALQKYIPPEVEVLLYTREKLEADLVPVAKNWHEARLNWFPGKLWTTARLSYEMLRRPPDLLWIPTHTIPFFAPKTAVTVHDVGFLARPELYKIADKIFHKFSTRRIINSATQIITVSEFSKQEIIKYCQVPDPKVSVTLLAPDLEGRTRDESQTARIRASYGLKNPYFIFVGRLERKKNIDGLLQSFALFRTKNNNVDLVLVGSPGFGGELAKQVARLQGSGVRLLGWTEEADLPFLMEGACALILPSHYEGFGLPVLEAMKAGTPVISSTAGSLKEVGGSAAIYINPDDPQEIARAMKRIYKEPALRSELRELGLKRAEQFSWDKTALETWQILKKML